MVSCNVAKNLKIDSDLVFCCPFIEKLVKCQGAAIRIIRRKGVGGARDKLQQFHDHALQPALTSLGLLTKTRFLFPSPA